MKTKIILSAILPVFFFACTVKDGLHVGELTCEYLVDPLGIDTETPRIGWTLTDAGHVRGQRQTAYHVLMATTPDKLRDGETDVWNSGKVASDRSHLVACDGARFQSGGDYYWKVRVYDRDGKASAWSRTARFSMGLLNRADWKGEWIKHPAATPDKHVWFRRQLKLDDRAASAFVYVASLGYHELYVNGKPVSDRVLSPTLTRLDKRVQYVAYDVADLLVRGDNIVALWYAPGWSRYDFFAPSVDQAFLLQMNGQTRTGTAFTLHSGDDWKCAESYSRESCGYWFGNMSGELVDGRRYSADWNTVGFDDGDRTNAVRTPPLTNGETPALTAEMTDPSRIIETIAAREIQTVDTLPGIWKIDMGKNFTGFLDIAFNGLAAGDTVVIRVSDRLNVMANFNQVHYYVGRGEDGERFRNRFNYSAGRYVYLQGLKQAPGLSDVKGLAVSSAAPQTGSFSCSDALFNRIYEVDVWTYRACNVEGFTVDCPHRERLGYGAESAWLTSWGLGLPLFETGAFYLKNLRDWRDVQMPDGWIHNTAPQINRHYGGPLYSGSILNLAWEHYLATGDVRALEIAYPAGKKWIEYLSAHTPPDGLLKPYAPGGRFLGEWVAPGPRKEFAETVESQFFNNCVYSIMLDLTARMADVLGFADEAASYGRMRDELAPKVHAAYFDAGTNTYLSGNQVQTVFPLYAGIAPDTLRPALLKHLEYDLTSPHPRFDFGSPSRYPYFNVLFAHAHFHEIISDILSRDTYPGYGYFLANGETAWPEYWEITDSRIHTSYTGISAWFVKGLAGIEPDASAPGYRTFTVRPNVINRLTYAEASVQSPYGIIKSGWRKDGDRVIYDVTVPVGTAANIHLPATASRITENGQPLENIPEIRVMNRQDNESVIHAEAGKYSFELTIDN
ncbi:MAG: glycoside hydrolase family 78 protein [Tannerella sp.]|jgi:alpha-L-rhamnosidase|nr:glycoside hydrolase family 78 protein [Tannerella sp.]